MKIDKLKVYVIELVLLAILSFALFVSNVFDKVTISILILICAIATSLILKKRNVESVDSKKVTLLLVFFAVIYLIGFYLMGIYFGYYKAVLRFNTYTLTRFIIPTTIVIISSEIIRNVLLAQNTRFSKILVFIIMVLIDLMIYSNIYTIDGYDDFIEVLGFTLFASIACNLLYNYIASRYGIKGNIFYRLITVLYVYIIPFIPNVYVFFRSILRMMYPYIIYQVLDYTFAKNNMIVAVEDKRKSIISKIIFIIVTALLAMLISCQFKFGILVIGSGSMTGAINKGDAVFYKQYSEQEKIEVGQVIIFMKDDIKIVHRVVNIKNVNGEIRYITKGDANQNNDEGYITNEDIIGISQFRIAYIGYPSIWIRDVFSK